MFSKRQYRDELMDLPSTTSEEFGQALRDIQWVNRNLAGSQILMEEVIRMIAGCQLLGRPIRILDLGTGSADIPRDLVDWGRAHDVRFEITAVDIHPVAAEVSRKLSEGYPEIEVIQANALKLDYADNRFDVAISSMFMHHLGDEEAARLLREMYRLARMGFVVNDLERHPLAWLGISLLGRITGKGRIFLHDAPLSVLRGFTRAELEDVIRQAGVSGVEILHRWPFRFVLSCEKR